VEFFLAQPGQYKKSLALCFVLGNFTLQQNYISYFTSRITLPFQELLADNIPDLFASGFRIVLPFRMTSVKYITTYNSSFNHFVPGQNPKKLLITSEENKGGTNGIESLD
jgi:hypothetical protein